VSPKTLLLYSKPGCHLCQEMKAVVLKVAAEANTPIEEVDISGDPALLARYGEEIPVLFIDGRKAFKYRVSEKELRARLARS
jgi:glutaredoxin